MVERRRRWANRLLLQCKTFQVTSERRSLSRPARRIAANIGEVAGISDQARDVLKSLPLFQNSQGKQDE
jgi:hypothetical protein